MHRIALPYKLQHWTSKTQAAQLYLVRLRTGYIWWGQLLHVCVVCGCTAVHVVS